MAASAVDDRPLSTARRRVLAALVAFWVILAALACWRLWQVLPQDDAFIVFRYADNVAQGRGLVFNPGERVYGISEPGWALLLGLVHRVAGIPLPQLGALLFGLALVATAFLLAAEAARRGRLLEAALAGTLVLLSPFAWLVRSFAAPASLLCLAAAAALAARRPGWAGALAGAAVWMRPEAGLGAVLLAVHRWWRARRPPFRLVLAAAVVIGAGLLAGWLWFGQPLPHTLEAKRVQMGDAGLAEAFARTWQSSARWARWFHGAAAPWILLIGLLAGAVVAGRRGGPATALLVWYGGSLTLAYPLLGVPLYPWYVVPFFFAGIWGFCLAAGEAARRLAGRRRPLRMAVLMLAAAAFAVAASASLGGWEPRLRAPPRAAGYVWAGEWLRRNTAPGARVAITEIGTLAFHADRPVEDLVGLVSPRMLAYVARHDMLGGFRRYPAEYLVAQESRQRLMGIAAHPWVRRRWEPVAHRVVEGEEVTIYRLRGRYRQRWGIGGEAP